MFCKRATLVGLGWQNSFWTNRLITLVIIWLIVWNVTMQLLKNNRHMPFLQRTFLQTTDMLKLWISWRCNFYVVSRLRSSWNLGTKMTRLGSEKEQVLANLGLSPQTNSSSHRKRLFSLLLTQLECVLACLGFTLGKPGCNAQWKIQRSKVKTLSWTVVSGLVAILPNSPPFSDIKSAHLVV